MKKDHAGDIRMIKKKKKKNNLQIAARKVKKWIKIEKVFKFHIDFSLPVFFFFQEEEEGKK